MNNPFESLIGVTPIREGTNLYTDRTPHGLKEVLETALSINARSHHTNSENIVDGDSFFAIDCLPWTRLLTECTQLTVLFNPVMLSIVSEFENFVFNKDRSKTNT